jgi:DNA gyrase subunit A
MVVSAKGFGKRSLLEEYRKINRGGKGVKTINITEKTGKLIAIKGVTDDNELMIINKSGLTIRMDLKGVRIMGRATQGVTLIKLNGDDEIAAVAKVDVEEVEETDSTVNVSELNSELEGNDVEAIETEELDDAPEMDTDILDEEE